MGALNLRRCHLVLSHLLQDRRDELLGLRSGAAHVARLEALGPRVAAALDLRARRRENPVPALVREHIALIATLARMLAGERGNPLGDSATRAAAEVVHEAVVVGRLGPAHTALGRMDQADAVRRQRPHLAAPLAHLPPVVGALIDRWIDVGAAIGQAVAARATARRGEDEVALVRDVMRALGRLRRAIRSELEVWGDLPPETEARLLGFVDWLQGQAPGGLRALAPRVESDDRAPAPEPLSAPVPGGPGEAVVHDEREVPRGDRIPIIPDLIVGGPHDLVEADSLDLTAPSGLSPAGPAAARAPAPRPGAAAPARRGWPRWSTAP